MVACDILSGLSVYSCSLTDAPLLQLQYQCVYHSFDIRDILQQNPHSSSSFIPTFGQEKKKRIEIQARCFHYLGRKNSPLLSIWLNAATNSQCFGIKTYDIFSQQQIRGINIILSIMMLRRASIETSFKVEVKLKVQKQPRSMLRQNGCNTTLIGKKSMNGQNLIDKTQ